MQALKQFDIAYRVENIFLFTQYQMINQSLDLKGPQISQNFL